VEQGADKGSISSNGGWSLIYIAALEGHLEIVQCLVQQGASLNQRSNGGDTPLGIAVRLSSVEVANYLREQGACI
jgi:ankyrin repeat protein